MPEPTPSPEPALSPAAPRVPSAPTAGEGAACENCGTVLRGGFCHACGQSAVHPTRSVRAFASQAAADLTSLDSRVLRSLGLLLARPGRLTREFLDGRRIRYTQPVQLYLGCAAAFFFVNAYRPFFSFDPAAGQVVSSLGVTGVSGDLGGDARRSLAGRGISLDVFRERFEATVTGYLPAFLVVSVLLFALALHLIYRRPRRGYLEHALFALHWSAFYLLLMIVDRLLPQGRAGPGLPDGAISLVAVAYLGLALGRVYGQGRLITGVKAVGLFVVYQVLLSVWMASAIALAFELLT